MPIKTVAMRCQDFRIPIFCERTGTLTISPRYPEITEVNASTICPMSIISPASAAESFTTSMKNRRQNENMHLQRSLNILPAANRNISHV